MSAEPPKRGALFFGAAVAAATAVAVLFLRQRRSEKGKPRMTSGREEGEGKHANGASEDHCSHRGLSEVFASATSAVPSSVPSNGQPIAAGLPSLGSVGHETGDCKRCCFFPKGRCTNGYNCTFCHFDHEKRQRKKRPKSLSELDEEQTGMFPLSPTGMMLDTRPATPAPSTPAPLLPDVHEQPVPEPPPAPPSRLPDIAAVPSGSTRGRKEAPTTMPPLHTVVPPPPMGYDLAAPQPPGYWVGGAPSPIGMFPPSSSWPAGLAPQYAAIPLGYPGGPVGAHPWPGVTAPGWDPRVPPPPSQAAVSPRSAILTLSGAWGALNNNQTTPASDRGADFKLERDGLLRYRNVGVASPPAGFGKISAVKAKRK